MIQRVDLTYWGMAKLTAAVMVACRARWSVVDADLVPRAGPFILVSNHIGFADPPILVASVPRRIAFLAKEELTHSFGSNFILWAMGALTVRRGKPDRAALRTVLEALRGGQPVAIFPEGTRSRGRGLQAGHAGAALLAQWSGVPVVPTAIWGSEHIRLPWGFFTRPALTVRVGRPFTLSGERGGDRPRLSLDEATERIMQSIAALLPPSYRGVYAGGDPVPALRDADDQESAAF